MKVAFIEPGSYLKGHAGQIRSVLKVDHHLTPPKALYRQISNGKATGKDEIILGTESWIRLSSLASWAECDVTEIYPAWRAS
jgi:hypothetical protein